MAWPIKGIIEAVNKQGMCFGKFFEVKLSGGSKVINGRNYELCVTTYMYTGTMYHKPIIILVKEVIGAIESVIHYFVITLYMYYVLPIIKMKLMQLHFIIKCMSFDIVLFIFCFLCPSHIFYTVGLEWLKPG